MARGITSYEYVRGIGDTPARVNRLTGHLQINLDVWPKLPKEHQTFVLLHEEGHVVLNTSNELLVDEYAFKKYADLGYSLTESVKALTQVLNEKNPSHALRAYLQLQRALEYDYKVNKNPAAYRSHYTGFLNKKNLNMNETLLQRDLAVGSYDNLFGIGKKAKAKKAERQAIRKDRKASRIQNRKDKRAAKIERKKANTQIKLELAKHGMTRGGLFTKGIGSAIGSIFGGGDNNDTAAPDMDTTAAVPGVPPALQQSDDTPVMQDVMASSKYLPEQSSPQQRSISAGFQYDKDSDPKPKKNNTLLIVGGAIIVAVIIFLIFKKKKR